MRYLAKGIAYIIRRVKLFCAQKYGTWVFKMNNVDFGSVFFNGIPYVSVQGDVIIGSNFRINSETGSNPIGRNSKSLLVVRRGATLLIGDNVGMSGSAIVCQKEIVVGDNVKMGGNVCIYDTDFHSLNPVLRSDSKTDFEHTARKKVTIGNNVFIGAHSTILKGVEIGDNSIVGACSVVTKSIPANEIWAGNPARFIKNIPT